MALNPLFFVGESIVTEVVIRDFDGPAGIDVVDPSLYILALLHRLLVEQMGACWRPSAIHQLTLLPVIMRVICDGN